MAFCGRLAVYKINDSFGTYWQILLVGKNQENGIPQLILVQHTLEFLPGLDDTITIVAIHHEDDTLGVLEVMSPQRSDLVLSTNIPYGELDVLVLDGLNVESCRILMDTLGKLPGCKSMERDGYHTDCGNSGDDFTKLQLVKNSSLSGSIQTNHQNSHLLLSPKTVEDL